MFKSLVLLSIVFLVSCGKNGDNGSAEPTPPVDVVEPPPEAAAIPKVVTPICFNHWGSMVVCRNTRVVVEACGLNFRVGGRYAYYINPTDGFLYPVLNGNYETADGCEYIIDNLYTDSLED